MIIGRLSILLLTITHCYGLVAGPTQSKVWSFSSNIPFSLTVTGIDLSSSDTIRILESGSSCTDNSGDPVEVVSSMYYDCPDVNTGCTWMRSSPVVNIRTLSTSSSCNQFSASLACTGLVSTISSITVSTLGLVLVNFNNPPNLAVGDYIILNGDVSCGNYCTSNTLDLLMRGLTATNSARVGNVITNIPSSVSVSFSIPSFAGTTPPVLSLDQVNPPTWTRTSRQDTATALVGTAPKSNLVICWNKKGVASGYHVQLGTLSIVGPPLFQNVALYPYGFAPETSRFILTFSTSNSPVYSATPSSYTEQPALVITWTQPTVIRPIQNVVPEISVTNSGFSQQICGVYLDELWSSNTYVGFPSPKSCSITISSVSTIEVQIELVILFPPSNGLPPSSDFTIIFRGQSVPSSILSPSTSPCCVSNTCMTPTSSPYTRACQYIKIAYIPTYFASPYNALQMGFAKFVSTVPANFNRVPTHPRIASVAINTFSADNTLSAGLVANLMFTLTPGVIQAGYFVRIYATPALIWRLQAYCSGTAASGPTPPASMVSATPLTFCAGIELVPSSRILTGVKLQVPNLGQSITDFLFINLENIPTPSGGTFGSPFLVQITDTDDAFPFIISTSNQYVKQPDLLRSVAKITPNTLLKISSFVDMVTNVVLQIVPALPLAVGDEIKVTAPPGFTCNGISVPTIPSDLYENFPVPSGYGQVVAGTYSVTLGGDNRSCQVILATSLPAESRLMFTLNITTSSTPILITSPLNIWTVSFSRVPQTYQTPVFATLSDTGWQSNFAIISIMSNFHMEPMTSWVPPASAIEATARRVAMFFSPGTPIIGKGSIVIALPYMFTNASEHINWGYLDDYMYKTGGPNDRVIHRLPPPISPGYIEVGQQFAFFPFNGSLVSSWTYGFWIEVKPVFPVPVSLMIPYTSRSVWHIRTMYSQYGVIAAGQNPKMIPLFEGVYQQPTPKFYLAQVPMTTSFTSLVPFAVSATRSILTFAFSIPTDITTLVPVRISGPSTFAISKTDCVTVVSGSWIPVCNPSSQINSTNILIVDSAAYSAGAYSGQVSIRIPDRSPTRSLNKWRVEFGYQATSVYGPLIAESSDGSNDARILGLLNGAVVPESVVVGDTHFIALTIETISSVPSGGAIAVTVPSSIATILDPCQGHQLESTTRPTACVTNPGTNTVLFPGPWTPGTRTFYLKVQNVATPTFVSPSSTAPCFANFCFLFLSLSNASNLLSSIDYSLYVVSYSVLKRTPIGGFAPLTNSVVQQFVGVNNGPLNRNNFVLSFSVLPDASGEPPVANPPFILVRAPFGFEFDPTCTGTIGFLPSQVFSDTMPWPPQYTELTSSTNVTSCIGTGNFAMINISIPLAPTSGTFSYAIRLGVARNPAFILPVDSQWYVQIGYNQATSPFASFQLAIMDPTVSQITPSLTGYRVDLTAPIQSQLNPITIVLKPTTSVFNPGTVVINTPANTGFRFDSGWSCLYLKFSDGTTWDQASILCQVPSNQLSLSLTIPTGKTFSAGSVYTIETAVFNPTDASQDSAPSGSASWIVGTFVNDIPRDQSALPGFALTQPMAKISVTSNNFFGGLSLIPSLTILVKAQTPIARSTIISVQSPPGFNFLTNTIGVTPSSGGCFGLKTRVTSGSQTSVFSGAVTCNSESVHITVDNPLLMNDELQIILECINPATTPAFPNFWYFASSGTVFGGAAGWTILPQLSNVSVSLDGPNFAIKSYSHLTAEFSTVQECNMVRFTFPPGFDLSAGVFNVTQTINGLSVLNAITETVLAVNEPHIVTLTILTPISGGGVPVEVQMENIKLGNKSGSVTVSIATFLDDVPVDQYTDLLAFILAGQVRVVDQLLSSPYREAALLVEPVNSTLIPLLRARTGEIGIVHLSLFFSSPVLQNERFFVGSYWYEFAHMDRSQVTLVDTFSQNELGVSQISLLNSSMMFTVNSFIPVGAIARLSFPVKIPSHSNEAVSNFLIRSFVPGNTVSYPIHSNDNVTEGFVVSSPLEFTLDTVRSPPSAVVNVSLNIFSAGYRRIFTMKLVSPSGYYFAKNACLVSSGNFTSPLTCVAKNFEFSNNRSSAVFKFDVAGQGLLPNMLPVLGIQISIVTPSVQPKVGNWYLFGRGLDDVQVSWGVLTDPFIINPIKFFDLRYSNLVGIRTPLAVSFENLERVPSGGFIRLYYPDPLTIDCTSFMRTTLPFYDETTKKMCQVTTSPLDLMSNSTIKIPSRSFTIFMTYDLIPGNFSFTIDVLTPTISIPSPKFSLAIIGPTGNVYASILNVTGSGMGVSNALSLAVPSGTNARLLWYPTVAVAESVMKVGVSIISQNLISAGQVNSFMIFFPDQFLNAISIPSDLSVTNTSSLTVTLIDFSNPNFIAIYIDQSERISPGQFTFSFPVYVPSQVPWKNIWYVCACDQGSCTNPFDSGVMTYFPIAGFSIGQANPLTAN